MGNTASRAVWQARGLSTLFGFGVALWLGAVVTFVAHNWAYLPTGAKLGGIAGLLLLSAIVWVQQRFDTRLGVSLGIAAQVLIGVWLAAAGQIYQAPGGFQDLAINWACLGLPFAAASRNYAHWAIWLAVVVAGVFSPIGFTLDPSIGSDPDGWRFLVAGSAFLAVFWYADRRLAPDWFVTGIATVAALWLLGFGLFSIFTFRIGAGEVLRYTLALAAIVGGTALALQARRRASASLLAAGTTFLVGALFIRVIAETVMDTATEFGLLLGFLITAGLTYALVQAFRWIAERTQAPRGQDAVEADVLDDESGTPWYMDVLIATGGVVSALFGGLLLGSLIALIGAVSGAYEAVLAVCGGIIYATAVSFRRREPGPFLRFMLDTFILLGGGAFLTGVGIAVAQSAASVGTLALILAVVTAVLVPRDRILHVVLAAVAATAIAVVAFDLNFSDGVQAMICLLAYAVIGMVLGTVPLGGRTHPVVAVVFLLAAIAAGVLHDVSSGAAEWALVPRLLDGVVLLAGAGWIGHRLGADALPSLLVTGMLAVIAVILPLGAGPSLLLLLLGYAVRSRAMFGLGVLAMAYFLFATYYDLSLTLMELSGTFALTGAAVLGLWALARRRVEASA